MKAGTCHSTCDTGALLKRRYNGISLTIRVPLSLSLLHFLLNNNIKLFKKLTEIIIDDIYNINIYQRAVESIENNSLVVLDSADISFT